MHYNIIASTQSRLANPESVEEVAAASTANEARRPFFGQPPYTQRSLDGAAAAASALRPGFTAVHQDLGFDVGSGDAIPEKLFTATRRWAIFL